MTDTKTQIKYIIFGKVIKGDGYGRKIGFPTLNIDRKNFLSLKQKPILGVYSGDVTLNREIYKAGIVIGPLDKKGIPKVEAHLVGYHGDAYGKIAVLEMNKYIRKFKKFKTEQELIDQIKKDIKLCK